MAAFSLLIFITKIIFSKKISSVGELTSGDERTTIIFVEYRR
jgi:hypothetical protein